MATVTKGVFTANKDAGNGNDTVQITAPANSVGEQRNVFLIKNSSGTKQIRILCVQEAATTEIDFVIDYTDNVQTGEVSGTIKACAHGTNNVISEDLGFAADISLGYIYNDVYTEVINKPIPVTFRQDSFSYNVPVQYLDQGAPAFSFNSSSIVNTVTQSGYTYNIVEE